MLKVIDYIYNNGLDKLIENYSIDIHKYDDRITLNYNQITSPKHDDIVKECRGLILSWPKLEILSIGFNRFFNYFEDKDSENFNILKSKTYEKVDGSYIGIYHDKTKWCINTRKMAFAEGTTFYNNETSFKNIVETALNNNVNKIFKNCDINNTHIFELVSPLTRVVKPYNEICLYPLMIKNKNTFHEITDIEILKNYYSTSEFEFCNIKFLKEYNFNNYDSIIDSMSNLQTFDEGYVCLINNTINGINVPWRIKIKNPSYLAIANLRNNGKLSEKRIIKLVMLNDYDEYLEYFPEDRKYFQPFINCFNSMINELNNKLEYVQITNKKDIALENINNPLKHLLFALKDNKDIYNIFQNMHINASERLFDSCLKYFKIKKETLNNDDN